MRQDWTPEQLVDEWTLEEGDRELVGNKSGATRLGFALLLKFFQIEGRFPSPRPLVGVLVGAGGVIGALVVRRAVRARQRQQSRLHGREPRP